MLFTLFILQGDYSVFVAFLFWRMLLIKRTKLKYGTMMLKAYKKLIWMIELGAVYIIGLKGSPIMHPKGAL